MNKQEAIEEIKKLEGLTILDKTINFDSKMISKKRVLNIVKQLDELEKPVVPQFVADFYESIKDDFENKVYDICVQFNFDKSELNDDVAEWFDYLKSKPIETLVMMHKFGYEIEKERLYTVEIPNPNGFIRLVLCKECDGKLFVATFSGGIFWQKFGKCKLTESEIKEDFGWAWQFAKEVEE